MFLRLLERSISYAEIVSEVELFEIQVVLILRLTKPIKPSAATANGFWDLLKGKACKIVGNDSLHT